jgi:hypothetical protein
MRQIHWLSPYRFDDIRQIRGANMASVRLRAGALLSSLSPSAGRLTLGDEIAQGSDLCIVGKIGAADVIQRSGNWLEQIRRFRERGGKLVLDYTDDHLGVETPMSFFYREAIQKADLCVCSSRLLGKSLAESYLGPVEVIPDAIEIEAIRPKQVAHVPVSILWFGHSSNLKYLIEFLPVLQSQQDLKLLILTNVEGIKILQTIPLPIPSNLQVDAAEWGVETMIEAAQQCDLCIIPSDPADRRKAGASSNRLLTALALGLPTAAEKLDSYLEHESLFVDIRSEQMGALLANPPSFANDVIRAQTGPVPAHEIGRIGEKWSAMLLGL